VEPEAVTAMSHGEEIAVRRLADEFQLSAICARSRALSDGQTVEQLFVFDRFRNGNAHGAPSSLDGAPWASQSVISKHFAL